MDINNVISAFIGSFLGVASGFLGAVYLDWRRARRERLTHVLAVSREILSNHVRVQLLLKEKRREGTLEDQAWRELRVPLAGELPVDLYSRIASRYDQFGEMRKLYQELLTGESSSSENEEASKKLAVWADTMMEDNERLHAEIGARTDGLMRAVRRRERRRAERLGNQSSAEAAPGE